MSLWNALPDSLCHRLQRTLAVYQRVRTSLLHQHGVHGLNAMLEQGAFASLVKVELMAQGLTPPVLETSEGVYRRATTEHQHFRAIPAVVPAKQAANTVFAICGSCRVGIPTLQKRRRWCS